MSDFTKFNPDFTVGQQRFLLGTNTLKDYLPCDGSIVSQATYPELYAKVGLIPDGLTYWQKATSFTTSIVSEVTYGNVFVAAGAAGVLGTSTDGITWTARTSGTTTSILSLTYGNGLYVYAGNGGVLSTSTDGITWTARTSGTTTSIVAVTYGNGVYVYAAGRVIGTSTNGISWTTSTTSGTASILALTYGGGKFIRVGVGYIDYSTNGTTWTNSATVTVNALSVAYGNGTYAYGGNNGTSGWSSDGITWVQNQTIQQNEFGFSNLNLGFLNGVTFVGTTAIIVGADTYSNGFINITNDFVTSRNISNLGSTFSAVAYGNNKVVAVGNAQIWYCTGYTYDTSTQFALPNTSTWYLQYQSPNQKAFIKYK